MHLVEPVGDLLEALAEARLERRMQLLVDRRSHLLELDLVALLQRGEALLDRRAHFDEAPLVRLGQRPQLFAERVSEALQREVLRVASRVALRQQRLLKHRQGLADFLPRSDAASRDLVAQFALAFMLQAQLRAATQTAATRSAAAHLLAHRPAAGAPPATPEALRSAPARRGSTSLANSSGDCLRQVACPAHDETPTAPCRCACALGSLHPKVDAPRAHARVKTRAFPTARRARRCGSPAWRCAASRP